MPKPSSPPSLSIRIDLDTESHIGPGKIQLLENIGALGSISAASRAMGMSYKRAWDLVNEINRICGHATVEPQAGGKKGGGAILTPFGLSLVARYRKIGRSVEIATRKELLALRTDVDALEKALSGWRDPTSIAGPSRHLLRQHKDVHCQSEADMANSMSARPS